jgi:hypothetical protein
MPSTAFGPADFRVFELTGFPERMSEIRARIRPQLETLGHRLLPEVGRAIGPRSSPRGPAPAHGESPEDTWVAFAPDRRGYKKHCHFKVAISRNAMRFLFEVGRSTTTRSAGRRPEETAPRLGPVLNRMKGLACALQNSTTSDRPPCSPTSRSTTWGPSGIMPSARTTCSS